jgi:hypothetical protein
MYRHLGFILVCFGYINIVLRKISSGEGKRACVMPRILMSSGPKRDASRLQPVNHPKVILAAKSCVNQALVPGKQKLE